MLPMGDALAVKDTKAPKIVRAEMLDMDADGMADRVVLNYNEPIKHQLDSDGKYPFKVAGPDKATSYKIKKVNGAKRSTKLIIILKENPNGANKPDIRYTKTNSKPVTDLAKNDAKPQVFIKTIGLPLDATEFTLTINLNGPGKVSSTSSPSQAQQIDCGDTCQVTYPKDTDVNLSATPTAQSDTFANWAGDCSGTANACVIAMDANKTVTATFTAGGDMLLTVTKSGAGKVTSSPAGIDCGTSCSKGFPKGSSVTLTAVPDPVTGAKFIDWTGACSGVTTTCTVTMDAAKDVTAKFAYVLTVTRIGGGTVTSTPAGIACGASCSFGFAPDTSVSLSQIADSGSSFVNWSGACTGAGACTVKMDANKTVAANYGYLVTVTKSGNGAGMVTSDPAGMTCTPTSCTGTYPANSNVTLTATPDAGSNFIQWGGPCTGSLNQCTVTMNSAKAVTAQFVLAGPFQLNVDVPAAGGSVTSSPTGISCSFPTSSSDCTQQYPGGTQVTLTATPTDVNVFKLVSWGGACAGTPNTANCVVFMDAAKNVTANFGTISGLSMASYASRAL
jgi:hypothetical protein